MLRLTPMPLFVILCLGVCAAAAAAPVPASETTPDTADAASRLEELVETMKTGQSQREGSAASAASAPEPLVVIDGEEGFSEDAPSRRQLGSCSCDEMRNGATKYGGKGMCVKKEGKSNICYPSNDGFCSDMSMTPCKGAKGGSQPYPSPGPYGRLLEDAEEAR